MKKSIILPYMFVLFTLIFSGCSGQSNENKEIPPVIQEKSVTKEQFTYQNESKKETPVTPSTQEQTTAQKELTAQEQDVKEVQPVTQEKPENQQKLATQEQLIEDFRNNWASLFYYSDSELQQLEFISHNPDFENNIDFVTFNGSSNYKYMSWKSSFTVPFIFNPVSQKWNCPDTIAELGKYEKQYPNKFPDSSYTEKWDLCGTWEYHGKDNEGDEFTATINILSFDIDYTIELDYLIKWKGFSDYSFNERMILSPSGLDSPEESEIAGIAYILDYDRDNILCISKDKGVMCAFGNWIGHLKFCDFTRISKK